MWERLVDACERIADGAPPEDEAFRRARVIALVLAAQSDESGPIQRIAAMATVIQRRRAGVVPAREVIVLVRDAWASLGNAPRG
ncbi:hypothetical protein [Actinokineospora cianjurensis]|uniref:hypothetical protein n=1 Tax=Actinokineospora cianjurensis TaxID=585224 RepID=UPI0011C42C44|nr:hypothetical protein [Actinokineospora cianjurensis]